MKNVRLYFLLRRIPATILKVILFTIVLTGIESCKPEFSIDNPYGNIDWNEFGRYKANLHTHTSVSDGWFSPNVVVDRYHDLGYDILAITDHNVVTYPWEEFTDFKASLRLSIWKDQGALDDLPQEDVFLYENRDPDSLEMIAIQANEISHHHHLGSYFSNFGHYEEFVGNSYYSIHTDFRTNTIEESLEGIGTKNGLAVLFHPGSYDGTGTSSYYSIDSYIDLFRRFGHLIGMEAYNNASSHIHRWDSVLTGLMPDRQVWGFSNDDFHRGGMGRTWNVFLLPELSLTEVRDAMENGSFYFVCAPEGHEGPTVPEINSIKVNPRRGTIQIDASGHQYIEWISDGVIVHVGDRVRISDLPFKSRYVRANIYESKNGPVTGTQPFGIRKL